MTTVVLASASPQRKQLLEGLGMQFTVVRSAVDEEQFPERDPLERARLLAEAKALDVKKFHPQALVIGCDTLVVGPDGTLLEKPHDETDARRMLHLQSGNTSVVHSGLAVIAPDGVLKSDVSSSSVRFRALAEADVDWWMRSGQWQDRSGGFQIDGQGQLLIAHLEGDFTSVVGLPVFLLGRLCQELGVDVQGLLMR